MNMLKTKLANIVNKLTGGFLKILKSGLSLTFVLDISNLSFGQFFSPHCNLSCPRYFLTNDFLVCILYHQMAEPGASSSAGCTDGDWAGDILQSDTGRMQILVMVCFRIVVILLFLKFSNNYPRRQIIYLQHGRIVLRDLKLVSTYPYSKTLLSFLLIILSVFYSKIITKQSYTKFLGF